MRAGLTYVHDYCVAAIQECAGLFVFRLPYFTMTNAIMHNIRPARTRNESVGLSGKPPPDGEFRSGSRGKKTISFTSGGGVVQTPLNLCARRLAGVLYFAAPAVVWRDSPGGKRSDGGPEQMVELISKTCSKWIRE